MIKYEFMRAHGKGSEGSEKGGGAKKKGVRKKGGCAAPPFFQKGGCTQHRHPPLCTPLLPVQCLGMLPLIWTEDETGSECKSYFNMYTFIIFIG